MVCTMVWSILPTYGTIHIRGFATGGGGGTGNLSMGRSGPGPFDYGFGLGLEYMGSGWSGPRVDESVANTG